MFRASGLWNQNSETLITKISPFELVYGQEVRLPVDLEFPARLRVPLDEQETEEASLDYNAYNLGRLGQYQAAAYLRSVAQSKKMVRTSGISYKSDVGHYVRMRLYQRFKFEPYWSGPLELQYGENALI